MRVHLAHQEYIVPPAGDGFADNLLRPAIGVHLRRIDEGHAEVDSQTQRGDFAGTVARPLAHAPGTHPQRGHRGARGQCNTWDRSRHATYPPAMTAPPAYRKEPRAVARV